MGLDRLVARALAPLLWSGSAAAGLARFAPSRLPLTRATTIGLATAGRTRSARFRRFHRRVGIRFETGDGFTRQGLTDQALDADQQLALSYNFV